MTWVVDEPDRLCRLRGRPRSIRVDNGPEFAGRMLDQWAYLNRVELDFSLPGKPSDNAFIEAFNGRLRQEFLNASCFLSMADARARIEARRTDYNHDRPHPALGDLTPAAFAGQPNPPERSHDGRTRYRARTPPAALHSLWTTQWGQATQSFAPWPVTCSPLAWVSATFLLTFRRPSCGVPSSSRRERQRGSSGLPPARRLLGPMTGAASEFGPGSRPIRAP